MKGGMIFLVAIALLVQATIASNVLSLNSGNFDQIINDNNLIAVEFFAPWCGHCKALAPEWEKAATELADQVPIASVDCTAEKTICDRFAVTGYPTLKLFRKGNPSALDVARNAPAIVSFLKAETLPVPTILFTQEDLDAFTAASPVTVILHFDTKDDPKYFFVEQLAEQMRHVLPIGVALGNQWDIGGKSYPYAYINRRDDKLKVEFDGEFTHSDVAFWISRNKVPAFGPINAQNYMDYMNTGLPVGYLFVDSKQDNEDLFSKVKEVVDSVKSAVVIAWIDNNLYGQQAKRLGLSGQVIPCFAIDNPIDGKKFFYPEDQPLYEGTSGDLTSWLKKFAAGEIEAFVKSEPIPETNDGPVKVVVGHSFDSIVLDESKDVLVEFYAPWCGHCKKLAPVYEKLGEHFKDVSSVVIAKIDATANDVHPKYNVRGFPTILLFPSDSKASPISYEGSRELDDLIHFVTHRGAPRNEEEEDEEDGHDHDEL